MLRRIGTGLLLVGALAGCSGGATEEEIRDAVLLVGHATGSTVTRSVNARAEAFAGTSYDRDRGVIRFDGLDLSVFAIDVPYTALDGEVELGETEIGRASVRLEGGPIGRLEFGYLPASPLATEWTVAGSADGREFELTHTFDDVRAFRPQRR